MTEEQKYEEEVKLMSCDELGKEFIKWSASTSGSGKMGDLIKINIAKNEFTKRDITEDKNITNIIGASGSGKMVDFDKLNKRDSDTN